MTLPIDTTLDFQSVSRAINLPQPVSGGDAVNKSYADAIAAGVIFKTAVEAASTGANVTVAAPGAALDGVTLTVGMRVLLKDQTTAAQNGLYTWNSAATPLTRPTDYATTSTAELGDSVYVDQGTINNGNIFTLVLPSAGAITVDTTGTSWSQTNGTGDITVGTGLTKNGNQLALAIPVPVSSGGLGTTTLTSHGVLIGEGATAPNAVVGATAGVALVSSGSASDPAFGPLGLATSGAVSGQLPLANGGTGAATAALARAALGVPSKFSQTIGDGATTTFTITHNLNTTAVQVQVYDQATGNLELVGVAVTGINAVTVGPFSAAPASAGGALPGGTGKQVVCVG